MNFYAFYVNRDTGGASAATRPDHHVEPGYVEVTREEFEAFVGKTVDEVVADFEAVR